MILFAVRAAGVAAWAALMIGMAASPARADVLEIGPSGESRWLTGPNALAPIGVEETSAAGGASLIEVPAEAVLVPEQAVAMLGTNARPVPPAYIAKVSELSARFDLSPALIEALVWQESRWQAGAVSPAGARGLAQLMPGTARELGVNADDPFANLEGGARYLRQQINRFDGDLERALAAYNAGAARVIRAGGIPPIRETQTYVSAVLGRLSDDRRP